MFPSYTDPDDRPTAAEAEADKADAERDANERRALMDYLTLGGALLDEPYETEYTDFWGGEL